MADQGVAAEGGARVGAPGTAAAGSHVVVGDPDGDPGTAAEVGHGGAAEEGNGTVEERPSVSSAAGLPHGAATGSAAALGTDAGSATGLGADAGAAAWLGSGSASSAWLLEG